MFLLKCMVTPSRVSTLSMYGDIVTRICKHMMIEPYDVLIYHEKSQPLSNTIYNMHWYILQHVVTTTVLCIICSPICLLSVTDDISVIYLFTQVCVSPIT